MGKQSRDVVISVGKWKIAQRPGRIVLTHEGGASEVYKTTRWTDVRVRPGFFVFATDDALICGHADRDFPLNLRFRVKRVRVFNGRVVFRSAASSHVFVYDCQNRSVCLGKHDCGCFDTPRLLKLHEFRRRSHQVNRQRRL